MSPAAGSAASSTSTPIGPGRRADDLACLVAHLSTDPADESRPRTARVHRLIRTWVPVFDSRVDPDRAAAARGRRDHLAGHRPVPRPGAGLGAGDAAHDRLGRGAGASGRLTVNRGVRHVTGWSVRAVRREGIPGPGAAQTHTPASRLKPMTESPLTLAGDFAAPTARTGRPRSSRCSTGAVPRARNSPSSRP